MCENMHYIGLARASPKEVSLSLYAWQFQKPVAKSKKHWLWKSFSGEHHGRISDPGKTCINNSLSGTPAVIPCQHIIAHNLNSKVGDMFGVHDVFRPQEIKQVVPNGKPQKDAGAC